MAVLNFREVLPRTFSHRFGEAPTAQRKFIATLDGPTDTQGVLDAIGVYHGAVHPEYVYLFCVSGDLTESDRWHAEVTYEYALPSVGVGEEGGGGGGGGGGFNAHPLTRLDTWSFSTGGAQVPALFYYAADQIAPLVNSAGDFIENVTRPEAELRVTISGNRATFDYGLAAVVTNTLNHEAYLGGAPYTWLCAGIQGQQQVEVINGEQVWYYSFVTELIYRESTHLLFLPDIGFNYLAETEDNDNPVAGGEGEPAGDPLIVGKEVQPGVSLIEGMTARQAGGVKKRAWVWHVGADGIKEKVPTANPIALNPDGSMKPAGAVANLLVRRVHRIADFSQFFGVPAF
jgi:hypothetical protein